MSQIYTDVGFGCVRRFADLRGPTSRVTSPLNDLEIGLSHTGIAEAVAGFVADVGMHEPSPQETFADHARLLHHARRADIVHVTKLEPESPVASWTRGASKTRTGATGGNAPERAC